MSTTNYTFNLPTVGGSEDTWGTQLNANWTALDTLLFSGTIGATATSAIALATARTINGVSFNGTANITLPTVNDTGNQNVAGIKTFTDGVGVDIITDVAGTGMPKFGESVVVLSDTDDLDLIENNGFYGWAGTSVPDNSPVSANCTMIQLQRTAGIRSQVAFRNAGDQAIFVRGFSSGAWQSWYQVFHQNTILGTVSESGGVPTGAVIQQGSNANGRFVRYADGTQICYHRIQLTRSSTSTLDRTWTYPISFSTNPRVCAIISDTTGSFTPTKDTVTGPQGSGQAGVNSQTIQLFRIGGFSNFVAGDTCFVDATATGRWF
jgi:hypothetical protein